MNLDVQWNLLSRKKTRDSGAGRTVDLSSGGILFEAGCDLPVGHKVSLSIAWPALIPSVARMELDVEGRVVRSDGARIAIQTLHQQFRTAASSEKPRAWTASAGPRLIWPDAASILPDLN